MPEPVGKIFDKSFTALERGMEIAARRQEVITHNIANANTPGFEALTFNEELLQAEKRIDKTDVVLEEELAALTANSIDYSAYVKILSSKINMLRGIASQGKR